MPVGLRREAAGVLCVSPGPLLQPGGGRGTARLVAATWTPWKEPVLRGSAGSQPLLPQLRLCSFWGCCLPSSRDPQAPPTLHPQAVLCLGPARVPCSQTGWCSRDTQHRPDTLAAVTAGGHWGSQGRCKVTRAPSRAGPAPHLTRGLRAPRSGRRRGLSGRPGAVLLLQPPRASPANPGARPAGVLPQAFPHSPAPQQRGSRASS